MNADIVDNSPYEDIKRAFLTNDEFSRELGEGGMDLAFAGYYLDDQGRYQSCRKVFRPIDPAYRFDDAEKMAELRASYKDAREMARLHGTYTFGVYYCALLPDGEHIRTGQYAIMLEE